MGMKKKILAIDDSSTNIVLLNAVLAQEGYEVLSASSAVEAYQLLEEHAPDLILLDLLMPEVSGFDFLENIKRKEALRKIPVVIVSAVGTKENISLSREMGAVSFISKPIDVSELIKTIRNLLQN